jgi:hypothetical protein
MKAWMSGVGGSKVSYSENIWELDNFERGRRIRKLYGANLPDNFPVICSFTDGKAVIIKSLDFTTKTYSNTERIHERLKEIINVCEEYNGQGTPWGKDNIIIRKNQILSKEIVIVVPSDVMTAEQARQFEQGKYVAESKGIQLRIEKYGYKNG